ncbi:hypothetical protein [Burkholderia pseudomultivorans]|uniref:hypothetical protein n=1 Tax=Burkholderia pseudomultivorans TaxID=1207504 RepID=UPI000A74710C|nr:hypothetical protein [Burkholderia pseudomultivorans]
MCVDESAGSSGSEARDAIAVRARPGGIQSAQTRLDDASRAPTFIVENVAAT